MGNKHFFVQMGVFVLLGTNIAVYYIFWPTDGRWSSGEVKASAPEASAPATSDPAAPEKNNGDEKKSDALPGLPELPTQTSDVASSPSTPKDEVLKKELQRIKSESLATGSTGPAGPALFPGAGSAVPLPTLDPSGTKPGSFPVLPVSTDSNSSAPRELPKLKAAPLAPVPLSNESLLTTPSGIAVVDASAGVPAKAAASLLETKLQQSPWLLKMEVVGAQTQIIAQLRHHEPAGPLAEFKILCDRVDLKTPDGPLQAVGKVTFAGAGLRGSCKRLTLPLGDMRILFEEGVEMVQEAVTPWSVLHSDKILWEMPSARTPTAQDIRPASFLPPTPVPMHPHAASQVSSGPWPAQGALAPPLQLNPPIVLGGPR